MVFSVTLEFRGDKSLLSTTDLLLTFDKQSMEGVYSIFNPVAWKVTSFPAGGGGSFKATYTADLAFTRAQIDGGSQVSASYFTHINVGEETTLTVTSPGPPATYAFSTPVTWPGAPPDEFQCINQTGGFQNIGVGFYEEGLQDPDTSIVINNVPDNGSSVAAQFTPILSAYVITGFVQNQIITAQIQSDLNWDKDLTDPSLHLIWRLTESEEGFELVEDVPE